MAYTWDEAYGTYANSLRAGDVTNERIKELYGDLSPTFAANIIKIKSDIDAQKKAGTAEYWGAGNLASPDSAAWDAAFRLAEKGVGSLYDLRQQDGVTVNTKTGQPLVGFGNAYNHDLDFNLAFNDAGLPILTASNQQSDWVSKYRTPLTAAALLAAGIYGPELLAGAGAAGGAGTGAAAVGSTELAGLAASQSAFAGAGGAGLLAGAGMTAEQLAAANALGGAEVAGGLTSTQASAAGLGGGFTGGAGMLSGAAAMTPEQAAAMEGLGGSEVAGGMTSQQASAAGLGGGFTGVPGSLSSLSPSQISSLAKAAGGLLSAGGAAAVMGGAGGGGSFQAPTQGVPQNNQAYYNQLQQYYNGYMPNAPRDVATPLQNWYNGTFGGAPAMNTGAPAMNYGSPPPSYSTTSGSNITTAGNIPQRATPQPVVAPNTPQADPRLFNTGFSTENTPTPAAPAVSYEAINSWLNSNKGATDAQIVAAMKANKVSPYELANATGSDSQEVVRRYNNAVNQSRIPSLAELSTRPNFVPNAEGLAFNDRLMQAYNIGNIDQVNSMIALTGLSAYDIQQNFRLTDAQLNEVSGRGVKYAQ
jgi:hypothetical protein